MSVHEELQKRIASLCALENCYLNLLGSVNLSRKEEFLAYDGTTMFIHLDKEYCSRVSNSIWKSKEDSDEFLSELFLMNLRHHDKCLTVIELSKILGRNDEELRLKYEQLYSEVCDYDVGGASEEDLLSYISGLVGIIKKYI